MDARLRGRTVWLLLVVIVVATGCGRGDDGEQPDAGPSPRATAASAGPSPSPSPQRETYTVKSGDTLSQIAQRFDTTIEAIVEANDLDDPDKLGIGDELVIPPEERRPNRPERSES